MDTDTLVDAAIDDGNKLVERLRQGGLPVMGAAWLLTSERGRWRFYIVSPLVDTEGLAAAYRRLHPAIYAAPRFSWIKPLKITFVGPEEPIAKAILDIYRATPGPWLAPLRLAGTNLGNVSIEAAYVLPLPAAVTV